MEASDTAEFRITIQRKLTAHLILDAPPTGNRNQVQFLIRFTQADVYRPLTTDHLWP